MYTNYILEVSNVSKKFGRKVAVSKVSFTVKEREIFALLGPSGSGKTTLLKLIAGLLQPDEGVITIKGVNQDKIEPQNRDIGFVFQDQEAVFSHLTVFKNIAFPFKVKKRKNVNPRWREQVNQILSLLRLDSIGNRYPSKLSGGERQRVALARAIVYKPPLLLLDEPLRSLHNALKDSILDQILEMRRKFGTTMIYVTHDEREALAVADRVAVIVDGRIAQVGEVPTLVSKPSTSDVALLLGEWNIFEGKVEAENPSTIILNGSDLRFVIKEEYRKGTKVVLGVPIDKTSFIFDAPAEDSPDLHLKCTVDRVVPWYGNYRMYAKFGHLTFKLSLTTSDDRLVTGNDIFIRISPSTIQFWPKPS